MKRITRPINTSFRAARFQDLSEILAIEKSAYAHPWNQEKFINSFDNPNIDIQLILLNKQIVGYLLMLQSVDFIDVLNICIDPKFQHQGLAKKLLDNLLEKCQKTNVKSILLEVRESNLTALTLYQKSGFKPIDTRKKYYSNGEDAKILRLQII